MPSLGLIWQPTTLTVVVLQAASLCHGTRPFGPAPAGSLAARHGSSLFLRELDVTHLVHLSTGWLAARATAKAEAAAAKLAVADMAAAKLTAADQAYAKAQAMAKNHKHKKASEAAAAAFAEYAAAAELAAGAGKQVGQDSSISLEEALKKVQAWVDHESDTARDIHKSVHAALGKKLGLLKTQRRLEGRLLAPLVLHTELVQDGYIFWKELKSLKRKEEQKTEKQIMDEGKVTKQHKY